MRDRSDVREHAFGVNATLCGIPENGIEVYRHYWRPGQESCRTCVERAAVIDARWPADAR